MFKPNGIIPALVTPFDEAGKVNEAILRKLVRNTLEAGCHGVFGLGSNGEFFSLSAEEKLQIARVVVEEVQGRVPVYMGTGGNSTIETIALTNEMEKVGVTAVSIITPYFVKLSDQEILSHYKSIAKETKLPIILYNIPGLTGNTISPKVVEELAKVSNIVGVKDSSGSFDNVLQYIQYESESFSVLVGTDSLILPTLMAGGSGAIAATANLLPKVVVSIYENWNKGNLLDAERAQEKLAPIRFAFKKGTLPSVLKDSINQSGLVVGNPRMPVLPVTEKVKSEIGSIITAYKEAGDLD
ncbi:4-hydroxy-tetrahydrodipicolinate synthase [Radiobacillus kanasensis]|uniref:4-hydroxy-tetrahydrodipicolinate synthase n=1 Tax=Radiobacillus kanasensis TaxID=2844358 RepID=UPI001E3ED982|nr:4-hydroxy-tetrahydrodipicolinate synthase [Radiobacillus kanasensis]UFT98785.1 4-hydroxy-tetrahydrodipicolinate synthase [Radiobacillus kanasensis]